jgi:hypothetical protein
MKPSEIIEWIENATYAQMLERWRFSPPGDSMFVGGNGDYFRRAMEKKKAALSPQECVEISKRIGWDR